jgi:hypothetical protein
MRDFIGLPGLYIAACAHGPSVIFVQGFLSTASFSQLPTFGVWVAAFSSSSPKSWMSHLGL